MKLKQLCVAAGNIKWCNRHVKQVGGSSESQTLNCLTTQQFHCYNPRVLTGTWTPSKALPCSSPPLTLSTCSWRQSEGWNPISCIHTRTLCLLEGAVWCNRRLCCRNECVRPWPKSRTLSMLEGVSSWCSQMLRTGSRENKWTRKGCYTLMRSNCMIYLLNGGWKRIWHLTIPFFSNAVSIF